MYSIKIVLFYFLLSYDYLRITDENSNEIGKYCALLTGSEVFVGGKKAVLRFHSDRSRQRRGYVLMFTVVMPST